MKTWLLLLMVGFSCCEFRVLARGTVAEPTPRAIHALVLVETSLDTVAFKAQLADTLSDRILSGLNSRLRPGDGVLIWTFNDSVQKGRYLPLVWNARTKQLFADRLARSIDDQPFYGRADLQTLMANLNQVIPISDNLTITIIGNGSRPLEGTPFDRKIATLYEHLIRRAGGVPELLVTTLLTERGRMVGWALEPAGGTRKPPAIAQAYSSGTAPILKERSTAATQPLSNAKELPPAREALKTAVSPLDPTLQKTDASMAFPGALHDFDDPELFASPGDQSEPSVSSAPVRSDTHKIASTEPPKPRRSTPPMPSLSTIAVTNNSPAVVRTTSTQRQVASPSPASAAPSSRLPWTNTSTPVMASALAKPVAPKTTTSAPTARPPLQASVAVAKERSAMPALPTSVPSRLAPRPVEVLARPKSSPGFLFGGATLLVGSAAVLFLLARSRRSGPKVTVISQAIASHTALPKGT